MKIQIIKPGQCNFSEIYKGKLFHYETGVYLKTSDDTAVVIYKVAGLMNAGETEKIGKDQVVWRITDAVFTVGEYK